MLCLWLGVVQNPRRSQAQFVFEVTCWYIRHISVNTTTIEKWSAMLDVTYSHVVPKPPSDDKNIRRVKEIPQNFRKRRFNNGVKISCGFICAKRKQIVALLWHPKPNCCRIEWKYLFFSKQPCRPLLFSLASLIFGCFTSKTHAAQKIFHNSFDLIY